MDVGSRTRGVRFVVLLMAGLLIVLMASTASAQSNTVISIDDYFVEAGDTFDATVVANSGTQTFGAAAIDLNYDPNVLTASNCTTGSALAGSCNIISPGVIKLSGVSTNGVSGEVELFTVSFTASGAGGTASDLAIAVEVFADPAGANLETTQNSGLAIIWNPSVPATDAPTGPICYGVTDGLGNSTGIDTFMSLDVLTGNAIKIGETGTFNIEAIAFSGDGQTLYAVNQDTLGTIDVATGAFTAIGAIGSGNGISGTVTYADVDSLTFDISTNTLFGAVRQGGALLDLLIKIDPATGAAIPDAFGAGVGYVVVPASSVGELDVDDIAADPYTGVLYGSINTGGAGGTLVTIDKATGAITEVGLLGSSDIEGLGFARDGTVATLYGSTGDNGPIEADNNDLYLIDKTNGASTLVDGLPETTTIRDYESLDCIYRTGNIGDTIWSDNDRDGNGIVDGDDVVLEGVAVNLLDGSGNVVATDTTDVNGKYLFADVPFGTYTVQIDTATLPPIKQGSQVYDPDGGDDDQSTVTISVDKPNDFDQDFAYFATGSIGDTIWSDDDQDGNAIVDGDDVVLPGVVVNLLDSNGNVLATETTDANGQYLFDELPMGTYTVLVDTTTLPDIKQNNPVFDPDGGNDSLSMVTLSPLRPDDRRQDFAYSHSSVPSGPICYAVTDGDGNSSGIDTLVNLDVGPGNATIIGETGTFNIEAIAFSGDGQTLYAVDQDTLGTLDLATGAFTAIGPIGSGSGISGTVAYADVDSLTYDITTDTLFSAVRQHGGLLDLLIKIDPATGAAIAGGFGGADYVVVPASSTGETDVDDIAADPYTGILYAVINTGGAGGTLATIDKATGAITELGPLGSSDIEALGFARDGTVATLYGSTGTNGPIAADNNDLYLIDKATGASYLRNGLPETDTLRDYESLDCIYQTGNIGDTIWSDDDQDGNGIVDGDDVVLEGVVVNLLDGNGNVVATDTTDVNGKYLFTDLPFGTYTVQLDTTTLPPIKQGSQVYDPDGGDDDQSTVTISVDKPNDLDQDFAYFKGFGSIGDTVWSDVDNDGNGIVDGDDFPIANVVVNLLDSSGAVIATDTTDANGNYLFENLPLNATYTVQVDTSTLPDVKQVNPAYDPDGGDDNQSTVTLTPDDPATPQDEENDRDQDFAYFQTLGSIGDQVWHDDDQDGNGVIDGDDAPIEGVVVNLLDSSGAVIATDTTDANGNYLFDQLPLNETYTVQIDTTTLPDVKQDNPTYDPDGGDDNQSTVTLTVDDPATPEDEANDRRQDFAYFQTLGSIGDTVWSDVDDDGNGTVDGDDFPIANVVVNLLDSSGAIIATETTDAAGQYLFDQLPLNETYTVQIDTSTLPDVKQVNPAYDPDGGDDNQSTVTLTVDDPATPQDEANDRLQDFAYFQTLGSIGDTVWSDVDDDGNGTVDGDDFPIANVVVNLLDSSGAVIATDTTDADGQYLFDQLPLNETYTVQIDTATLPDVKQVNPAYDPDGGDDNQSTVTLTVDDPATPQDEANDRLQDFAYFQTLGSIGDTVWSDVDDDGNGTVDGDDFPIANVVVNLLDSSGAVIATDTTDATGQYLFDQLPLNETYTVQIDTTTLPDVKQGNPAYDPDGGDDNQSTVTLTVDDPATPQDEANDRFQDFAYFQTLGSIGDQVWHDDDQDGNDVIDGDDAPIANVVVNLLDSSGAVIATDTTDANGNYLFDQLPLNETYTVQIDTTTLPDVKQDNPTYDPDGGDDNQSTVTLMVDDPATPEDEANDRRQDFAYFQTLGSIGDQVWHDDDQDGNDVIDGDDAPIEGVVVNLLDSSGAVIATDTTDANGNYLFDQLPLNETYTVQIDTTTLPDVKQDNPTYDPDGGDDNQSTVTLTVDDPATPEDEANDRRQDFAYFQTLGSIGDHVWHDDDQDGNDVIDGDDTPIEGVVVNLLDASGAVIATDTTDANGNYLFDQLPLNETYTVQIDTTTLPDVKQDNPTYDPDGGDDNQSTVTLTVDDPATPEDEANDRRQDFAYFQTLGSIGDTIWSDVDDDGNGTVDGNDFPIEGVVVKLLDSSGAVIATETTGADGQYLFDQLPLNATYTVQVDTTTLPDVKQGNPAYDPEGNDDNESTVTLTVDDLATPQDEANDRGRDFAYFQTLGSIGDTIWSDVDDDGNGTVDGDDFPIEGVVVNLLDNSGAVIATETTDASGQYLFDQLPLNATYTVQVDTTSLPNVKQGNPAYDPDGDDDNESTVTLTVANPDDRNRDFAYFQTLGTIGDTIWSDVDNDGNAVVDGEDFPIEGVVVNLLDSSGAIVATETTDADGKYLFTQLLLDTMYTVQVDTTTLPDVKQGNPAYDPDGGDDNQSAVMLTVDEPNNRDQDFAYFQTLGAIGDTIWSDMDADGNAVIDGDDFPLEGVVVNLLDNSGTVIATETTDTDGNYLFTQLPLNATYTVQINTTTLPDVKQGNPIYDPDGGNDNQSTVTLTVDEQVNRAQDFAYFQTLGSIGDQIWHDNDGDGNAVIDGDDFPIEGVVVKLLDSNGGVIATDTTDANGRYLFEQLPLNETYTVQIDTTTLPEIKQGNPTYDPDGGNDNQSTVTLTVDSPDNSEQDFAYFQTLGSIGDTIWSDVDNDGNGTVDGDDFPIEGVVVRLIDSSSGAVIATNTTDSAGRYLFDQLPLNATYIVQVDTATLPDIKQVNPAYDPDGGDDNQSTVTLTLDAPDNEEQDFAYFQTLGSIGDQIWHDDDNDGNDMIDGDDEPIANVTVNLLDSSGTVIATDVTSVNGQYLFDQLPLNATYTVQIDTSTLPISKQGNPAYDPDGDDDAQATVTLTLDAPDNDAQDFAYFIPPVPLGSIGNQVWHDDDNDGNGMIDGDDDPIAGVTVNLLDSTGAVIATDITDGEGNYLFTGLPLDAIYTVQIDTSTLPPSKQGNPAYDPDGGSDDQSTVTLTSDAPDNDAQDFAYFVPPVPLGSIGDTIWSDNDSDGNGMIDGDDQPLADVTVELLDANGNVIATDVTGSDGGYLFTGLPLDASYTVRIDPQTLPDAKQGNPAYDPDGGDDNQATVFLTTANPDNAEQDFAYFIPAAPLGSIGDQIWHDDDRDGNGILDGDDEPIEGVVVNLLDSSGAVIATTTTDANGIYLFSDLSIDATYTVQIDSLTLPLAKQGNPDYDPDGGNDNQSTVTLTADAPDVRDQDFAYFSPPVVLGMIGDQIWHDNDQDGNGILDGDDEPIEGVVVNLLGADGNIVATDTTDANGMYLFQSVPVGTYTVQIDDTTLPPAKQGNAAYDPDGGNDNQSTVVISSEALENLDQDFAYFAPILTEEPAIQILKTVYAGHDSGVGCPGSELESGIDEPITYCFEVQNTGGTHLNDIQVTDAELGISRAEMTLLSGSEPLASGASMMWYYETVLDRELVNTATTSGNPTDASGADLPDMTDPTDSDIAQVKVSASLGDFVWLDSNGNGVQEADEPGFEGIAVQLLDAEGSVLDSTTTDANGFYLFDDLDPGDYAIRVELPGSGYQYSPRDELDDSFDSDVDIETGISEITALDASESDRSWDAGIVTPSNLNVIKTVASGNVQPNGIVVYTLSYFNSGIGDATGVKLTEVVPQYTSFVADGSSDTWVCEGGATAAGTICTIDIGDLPGGARSPEDILFVVRVDVAVPSEVKSIDNQVVISDDGLAGPSASAQLVDNAVVELTQPTSLGTEFEPDTTSSQSERVFLPLIGRNQFRTATRDVIELSPDQIVLSWICSFMDNFGWRSDACFITIEPVE